MLRPLDGRSLYDLYYVAGEVGGRSSGNYQVSERHLERGERIVNGEGMKRITLSELYAQLEKGAYPIIDKEEKMVYVVTSEDADADAGQTSRLFHIVQEDPVLLEEEEFDFDSMAKRLTPGFDPTFLVKTALKEAPPKTLLDIKKRLEKTDASVKTKPGCVSLAIGGKRGSPIELVLRR